MFSGSLSDILWTASVWVIPILIAIPFHEVAHGLMAYRLGDDTAYQRGRLTLNPLRHIDPFGTIVLPIMLLVGQSVTSPGQSPFLFGYAKPVPVNFGRLRRPRRDMILVAAAGPAMNIFLAIVSALLINLAFVLPGAMSQWMGNTLVRSLGLNLILAVFNLIPLLPLDGGRVLVGLLPRPIAYRMAQAERFGMLILLGLLVVLPMLGQKLHMDLNVLSWLLLPPLDFLYNAVVTITGIGDKLLLMNLT